MPATATFTGWRSGAIDGAVPVAGMARSYKKPAHRGMRRLGAAQRNPSIREPVQAAGLLAAGSGVCSAPK